MRDRSRATELDRRQTRAMKTKLPMWQVAAIQRYGAFGDEEVVS
jgi:hypothetical protein